MNQIDFGIPSSSLLNILSGEYRPPERTAILDYEKAEDVPEPLKVDAFLRGSHYEVAVVSKRELDEIKHAHSRRLDTMNRESAELKDAIYKMFMAMKSPDQFVISPNYVENVEQWCKENCTGEHEVLLNHSNLGSLVVFDNSRDATLFKLFCGF